MLLGDGLHIETNLIEDVYMQSGVCECQPGFVGEDCSEECPEGHWGAGCLHECLCASGTSCHPTTGMCGGTDCPPGFTGPGCNSRKFYLCLTTSTQIQNAYHSNMLPLELYRGVFSHQVCRDVCDHVRIMASLQFQFLTHNIFVCSL